MMVGEEGVIAVDSTTIEKEYGPHLEGIRPVYDGVKKKLVDGYEVVSCCVVGAEVAWPIGLIPHRKAATVAERNIRRRRKAAERSRLIAKTGHTFPGLPMANTSQGCLKCYFTLVITK